MADSGLLATVAAGILFGTSIPLIKLGLAIVSPLSFVALRFLLAAILIVVLLRRKGWVDRSLLRSRYMWVIGAVNGFGYVLQFLGQVLATGSEAALIIGTAALMIPVISWRKGQERLTLMKSLGVVTGFLGVSLVVVSQVTDVGETIAFGQSRLLGDILLLGTAVTIALIFVYSKEMTVERGDRAVTGGLVITTAVLLAPFIPVGQTTQTSLNVMGWVYIGFLAVFGTVGAYYFFARGLERVSPTVSSIILPVEVIVSVVLSVIIFHDLFNVLSAMGAALIIAGVGLVSYSHWKP